jgi:hypothetical protein
MIRNDKTFGKTLEYHMTRSSIRNVCLFLGTAVILITGFNVCVAGNPALSISQSNTNVMITWPAQTSSNLVLVGTPGFDHITFASNNVIYVEIYPRLIISRTKYTTNGSNISVILPMDSANMFFLLQTNDFLPGLS